MNQEIQELRDQLALAERGVEEMRKKRELVARLEGNLETRRERLEAEQRDVHRLEGPGLVAFVRGLFADLDRELDRERRELATAVVLHDEARAELAEAREWMEELLPFPKQVKELRAQLEAKLLALSNEPGAMDGEDADELRLFERKRALRELRETCRAAEDALAALTDLESAVTSAHGLSSWDLLGGGAFISLMKHGQVHTARSRLATAQLRLRVLAREAEDLRNEPAVQLEGSPLTDFVDVFMDNMFTDWHVHTRLQTALAQTRVVTRRVRGYRDELHARIRVLEKSSRAERTDET